MFENLNGQTCLITGGAGGIGKSTAFVLGRQGMKVFIMDINDTVVQTALEELKAEGIVCDGAACDITDENSVNEAVDKCEKTMGAPYSLVNCAGIYKDVFFKDMTFEQWNQTLDVNLNGVYNCIKRVSRTMLKEERGTIVSLTSQAAISGSVMHSHYSASKAGIIGLTVSLAREFAQYGIRVNCVAPGIIKTPMTAGYSPERRDMFYNLIPMKRFGEPEETANVILFLVSDMSSYMTGQTINVTGGWLMHS